NPVHDWIPRLATVRAPVHAVRPERRVEDLRILRVDLEVSGAVRLRLRLPVERPVDTAVGRLPDAVRGVDGWRRAARAAAPAQHRRVEVVRVRGIDDDPGDRDALEVVARDVRPRVAAVLRLEHAVTEVTVAGQGALAGSRVDDRVVRWGYRQCADR